MTDLVLDHECSRCGGGAHDIMDEPREGYVTLWCVYCGLREDVQKRRLPRTQEQEQEASETKAGEAFRFQFGRFKGLTLAEAATQPNGRKYLEWMAKNNEKLGGRISEYLAQSP